ncbi:zinc ribbon domain-containing protein [Butyrivibrio sp. INlla21]|uniref:zinc ribbon domain-containing protein n=1 Tax=Butyrivibrio sp. INlla21 TaxID=1520811 RepID=UPI0008EE8D9D|nr:zinc ribbon domain-containing protein [Butyrivibrio sp. INlla21]SFU57380.1 hypothetical protein SAMN02910342_00942 [Butyrivibrio sp. INlla21]
MRNCPNCGAPIDPYMVHCPYCNTYYFDLTAFDCSKKCFVKFKTSINGQECYVTALAKPTLEDATIESNTMDCVDPFGNKLVSYATGRTCNLHANFCCQVNPEDKTLFVIEVEE